MQDPKNFSSGNNSAFQQEGAAALAQRRFEIFNQYRDLLFSIAYRMLSSVSDAEDMLQETFVRWHQSSDVDVQSPRAFLVTIITRLCINQLQSARVRREEYVGHWLPEPLLTSLDDPSAASGIDESLSMAFLVLLEKLTPMERAVFLLREVFDYDYAEVARILDQNEANCRQILRRARQHVTDKRPRFDVSPGQRELLLQQFMGAVASDDLKGLITLLSDEAVLYTDGGGKGPALPALIYGASKVARGLLGGKKKNVPNNLVIRTAQINGELGAVSYLEGKPFAVVTLDIVGGKIRNIYIVSNPEKLARLPGLPAAPS